VAEYWPYARTGGLAEAVSSLATYQAASGLPTCVILPLYRVIRQAWHLEPAGAAFPVYVGPRRELARIFQLASPPPGPRIYFIENRAYFDRPGIYGEWGADYPDNARRFAFFCQAALTALPWLAPGPQVLHTHDWHTALAPVYLRSIYAHDPYYRRLAAVLSVHNAGFQGHFPFETLADLGLPAELYDWRKMEWYGRVNFLKGGLVFSDVVTTVSPTHAHELRTAAGGFGLHEAFVALGDRLVGITNGIDFTVWNPETDPAIEARYSRQDMSGKRRCKAALQRTFRLPAEPRIPLFGMTARLVSQKGLDIILGGDLLTRPDLQFVFLGEGEARYERALKQAAAKHPDGVAVETHFADAIEHRLMAGADLFLMPSLYEPCGLTQMRAQRYGAIPVGRRVGGLADTIEDGITGFLFDEYSPDALARAVERGVRYYSDEDAWRRMTQEAMNRDFGWARSEEKYLDLYRRVVEARPARG
jgi:starch synthase